MKLTFKQYYDSKEILKRAGVENVRTFIEYSVTKYCKIPVLESYDSDKQYYSLKPKDIVQVLWEFEDQVPILKKMLIVNENNEELEYIPCWNSNKVYEWTESNCRKNKSLV